MVQPRFSVIVTVYNRENLVLRALESLENQTFSDFEIVIIDDASHDQSVEIISGFISRTQRKTVLETHEINKGQNAAINTALGIASGEYIAFLDSDDVWLPSFLTEFDEHINNLQNKDYGFHYCRLVGGPHWELEGADQFLQVLKQGYLSALGTLVAKKTSITSIYPLPERKFVNDMCQDDYISLELSRRFAFTHLPKELYLILGDERNRTTSMGKKFALGWFQFLDYYKKEIVAAFGYKVFCNQCSRVCLEILRSRNFRLANYFTSLVIQSVPAQFSLYFVLLLTKDSFSQIAKKTRAMIKNSYYATI